MRLGAYLALMVATVVAATSAQARDGSVLIRGARVFDGTRMLGVKDVLVRDGRIVAVARRVAAPSGIELIEARGRVLIPGLIDGHIHVFPGAQADALRFGVTTVFDMYSLADRATIDHWRKQRTSFAEVGEADTFTAGIGATPPGGHPLELFSDMPKGTALPPTLAPGMIRRRSWTPGSRPGQIISRCFRTMVPGQTDPRVYPHSRRSASRSYWLLPERRAGR